MPEVPEEGQERNLTFWEQAVGLTFNPWGLESVNRVKKLFAELIDIANDSNKDSDRDSYMKATLRGMAIRSCIAAQMAVVKLITWKD